MSTQEQNVNYETPSRQKKYQEPQSTDIKENQQDPKDYEGLLNQIETDIKLTQEKLAEIHKARQNFPDKLTQEYLQLENQRRNFKKDLIDLNYNHIKYRTYLQIKINNRLERQVKQLQEKNRIQEQQRKIKREKEQQQIKQKMSLLETERKQRQQKQKQEIKEKIQKIQQERKQQRQKYQRQQKERRDKQEQQFQEKLKQLEIIQKQRKEQRQNQQRQFEERIKKIRAGKDQSAPQASEQSQKKQQQVSTDQHAKRVARIAQIEIQLRLSRLNRLRRTELAVQLQQIYAQRLYSAYTYPYTYSYYYPYSSPYISSLNLLYSRRFWL